MNDQNNERVMEISVIMPCLNEEKAVGICIDKCLKVFKDNNLKGEVIIVDNGSTDRSAEITLKKGAKLVQEPKRGYGSAYLKGFSEARGNLIVIGDADDTYDFLEIPQFIQNLKNGYEFVIGNRLGGKIQGGEGTMPWVHRYIGNPVLTILLKLFFGVKTSDVYCGMRGITKDAYNKLSLKSGGMEFALEMVVSASRKKLKTKELPISYGLRIGESKLRTFSDGWRSLKFILLYAPNFLFMWPSFIFFVLGTVLMLLQINGPFVWGNIYMGIHTMILGLSLSVFGAYIFQMGAVIKLFSDQNQFYKQDKVMKFLQKITIEKGLAFGGIIMLLGLLFDLSVVLKWAENSFKNIFMPQAVIFGLYLMLTGMSFIFFSFLRTIMDKE